MAPFFGWVSVFFNVSEKFADSGGVRQFPFQASDDVAGCGQTSSVGIIEVVKPQSKHDQKIRYGLQALDGDGFCFVNLFRHGWRQFVLQANMEEHVGKLFETVTGNGLQNKLHRCRADRHLGSAQKTGARLAEYLWECQRFYDCEIPRRRPRVFIRPFRSVRAVFHFPGLSADRVVIYRAGVMKGILADILRKTSDILHQAACFGQSYFLRRQVKVFGDHPRVFGDTPAVAAFEFKSGGQSTILITKTVDVAVKSYFQGSLIMFCHFFSLIFAFWENVFCLVD